MSILSLTVTTLALTAIIALRYLAMAGLAHLLIWPGDVAKRPGTALNRAAPNRQDVLREMRLSVLSSWIYALPAAVALEAWKAGHGRLYTDIHQYGIAWLGISALIYLLVQDTFYYWLHRALHHPRLFAVAHAGHHRSREPTPWASFAFDPLEAALTAWLLPALTFAIPLHVGVALGLLTLMSLAAVFNHAGRELWPQRFVRGTIGDWLIGATHHSGHHARLKTNYGLYLRVWDRVMGTDVMPDARDEPERKPAPSPPA